MSGRHKEIKNRYQDQYGSDGIPTRISMFSEGIREISDVAQRTPLIEIVGDLGEIQTAQQDLPTES